MGLNSVGLNDDFTITKTLDIVSDMPYTYMYLPFRPDILNRSCLLCFFGSHLILLNSHLHVLVNMHVHQTVSVICTYFLCSWWSWYSSTWWCGLFDRIYPWQWKIWSEFSMETSIFSCYPQSHRGFVYQYRKISWFKGWNCEFLSTWPWLFRYNTGCKSELFLVVVKHCYNSVFVYL